MSTAFDIMHRGVECIFPQQTLLDASRKMRNLDIGSLPICTTEGELLGILTDRDIVVKCLAESLDPALAQAGEFTDRPPVSVPIDVDEDVILQRMEEHAIRRLPVTENDLVVGIISEADLARALPEEKLARFVEMVCGAA